MITTMALELLSVFGQTADRMVLVGALSRLALRSVSWSQYLPTDAPFRRARQ